MLFSSLPRDIYSDSIKKVASSPEQVHFVSAETIQITILVLANLLFLKFSGRRAMAVACKNCIGTLRRKGKSEEKDVLSVCPIFLNKSKISQR